MSFLFGVSVLHIFRIYPQKGKTSRVQVEVRC